MYINRYGEKYYLHIVKLKSGKERYTFTKNDINDCISTIPDGYEIYEPPNSGVFLRKISKKALLIEEVEIIEKAIKKICKDALYILDNKKNGLEIFVNEEYRNKPSLLGLTFLMEGNYRYQKTFYEPTFKICKDKGSAEYNIERFCFLGGIEDWIYIERNKNLKYLCEKYFRHINKESFYELM